jgi:hypothetical protein
MDLAWRRGYSGLHNAADSGTSRNKRFYGLESCAGEPWPKPGSNARMSIGTITGTVTTPLILG